MHLLASKSARPALRAPYVMIAIFLAASICVLGHNDVRALRGDPLAHYEKAASVSGTLFKSVTNSSPQRQLGCGSGG